MAQRDFIISYFAGGDLMNQVLGMLHNKPLVYAPSVANRKYKDFVMSKGNSVQRMFDSVAPSGDTIGRVCVMGFSEGCMGVRATLETSDAAGIDSVFACDGIHSEYEPNGKVSLAYLNPYISFARMASAVPVSQDPDEKLLVVTHSSIIPARPSKTNPGTFEKYPSTSETALILSALGYMGGDNADTIDCAGDCAVKVNLNALNAVRFPSATFPVGMQIGAGKITDAGWTTRSDPTPGLGNGNFYSWYGYADGWYQRFAGNNMYVFGWGQVQEDGKIKTKDPTGNRDHVFQANVVLPLSVRQMLVNRWNGTCEPMSGLGDSSCKAPQGRSFNYGGTPGPLPPANTGDSIPAPAPPPTTDVPKEPEQFSFLQKSIVFGAGIAGGYYGARWLAKSYL